MRELRLLRQDADSATLIFGATGGATADDEQFVLHVDDMVRAAVHFDVAHAKARPTEAPPASAPAPASPVSPREIQTRVRAGDSAEAIADQYGVDLAKVLRFAFPVLEERSRIASEARRARARGGPGEGRPVVFGDFVDLRLGTLDVTAASVRWDARRRADGEWVVRASWPLDEQTHAAEWIFHRTTRSVTAADQLGAELLSDRPLKPTAPPARIGLAVAPESPADVVAFSRPDADTAPVPSLEDFFDQDDYAELDRVELNRADLNRGDGNRAAVKSAHVDRIETDGPQREESRPAGATAMVFDRLPDPALPVEVTVPAGDGSDQFGTPPLPLSLSEPNRARRPERRREPSRQSRAKVPSWDDILLGVKPKGE